ncbi:MAG TPA: hypothetical protein VGJ18_06300, partial [Gemmatimonadaceae bacterium]
MFRRKHSVAAVAAAVALSGAAALAIHVEIDDSVASANPRAATPNVVIDDYVLSRIAQGSDPLENPSGVITTFGYLSDGTRTEPDENTYLEFDRNPGGPTRGYDYGRRFLFQGHENAGGLAYVTRINLDIADPAHRITLLTPVGLDGTTGFSSIDGSTWNPFTRSLLLTQENASTKGVIELDAGWPATVRTLEGIVGTGGFEGIHPDDEGNLLIIEDAGGVGVNVDPADPTSAKTAKQPNSFVYKFEPYDRRDLSAGGRLFALQVWIDGSAITFRAADPVGDTFSALQLKLHMLGTSWPVQWVLVHDTATDGFTSFSANAMAKVRGASPFKRPENAQFLPGSNFETFFFCPTGDTDAVAGAQPALAKRGTWGSIFRVDFHVRNPIGSIGIVVRGDAAHASFDNLTFADDRTLLATEDRGDPLHEQLGLLDSVWAFDVRGPKLNPRRLIALGDDSEAAAIVATGGEGDNEPTGLHVSDGDPSAAG